jgi:hypothetical protein
MSEEIKPCPFCGLVPKTEEIGNDFKKPDL